MIRWWVTHPVNTDNYEVFIVAQVAQFAGDDDYTGHYWYDGDWHRYHYSETIRPALSLPGLIAAQMEANGREDQNLIRQRLEALADEIWQQVKGKEPANDNTSNTNDNTSNRGEPK